MILKIFNHIFHDGVHHANIGRMCSATTSSDDGNDGRNSIRAQLYYIGNCLDDGNVNQKFSCLVRGLLRMQLHVFIRLSKEVKAKSYLKTHDILVYTNKSQYFC